MKNNYFQTKRCDLDITPNSHDYLTKKYMVLVGRMNSLVMEMKGLNTEIRQPLQINHQAHSPEATIFL